MNKNLIILNENINIEREKRHRELEKTLLVKYLVGETITKSLVEDLVYSSNIMVKVKGEKLIAALKRDLASLTTEILKHRENMRVAREQICEDPTVYEPFDHDSGDGVIDAVVKIYKISREGSEIVNEESKHSYNDSVFRIRQTISSIQMITKILPMIDKEKEYDVRPDVAVKVER